MIKWVARLACLTVFLGLTGTILIVKHLGDKRDDEKLSNDQNTPGSSDTTGNTIIVERRLNPAKILNIKEEKRDIIPPAVFLKEKKAEKEKVVDVSKNENKISDKVIRPARGDISPVKANEPSPTELSQEDLQELVNRIALVKEENGIYSNCVQIYTSRQSDSENVPLQVESYLRSKSFSIAGRETSSKKIKGIQITPAGECIRITIGSF